MDKEKDNNIKILKPCNFCNQTEDNELLYGKIYGLDEIFTHYYCLLLSSNMEQNGADHDGILGFLKEDILKELKRGKRLVCWYCKKSGATLGCCVARCKKVFHLPCGRREGSLHQFFGQFKSFCAVHRPIQKIDPIILSEAQSGEATCTICYDGIVSVSSPSALWAPCCRINAWFHRDCVQRLATSAGYFFKCPLCNNKTTFQRAMLDFGIYIPEQDASWELVPNAFQELLHRHNRCDSVRCHCPKGRYHEMVGTRWELVLCRYCGSQGIHVGCGPLKWSNPEWECPECMSMLERAEEHGEEEEQEENRNNAEIEEVVDDEHEPLPSDIDQSPPMERESPDERLGPRERSQNIGLNVPLLDSLSSERGGPVSPPTPITVVEVSDDEVIEILDDDEEDKNEPSGKPLEDNQNTILSCDGRAIPVVHVTSIPASGDGQNFCVVGDLNVRLPGQMTEVQQSNLVTLSQSSSVEMQSAVSSVPAETSKPAGIVRVIESAGESSNSNKRLRISESSPAVSLQPNFIYNGQSVVSVVGTASSREGLLKTFLTSDSSRKEQISYIQVPTTDQQRSYGQLYTQSLASAAAGRPNSRRSPNSSSNVPNKQCIESRESRNTAAPARHHRPHRLRSNGQQSATRRSHPYLPSQRESRHNNARVIPSNVMCSDFRFRVLSYNTLQMVFNNRFIVSFDLRLPHGARPHRRPVNRPPSAPPLAVQRDDPERDSSSQTPPLDMTSSVLSTSHHVQEAHLDSVPLPNVLPTDKRDDSACISTPSEKNKTSAVSEERPKTSVRKRKKIPNFYRSYKRKRRNFKSSQTEEQKIESPADVANRIKRNSRTRSASMSSCPVGILLGRRSRSPIHTRSWSEEACMQLRSLDGRRRLLQSAVVPVPGPIKRLRRSRSAQQLSHDESSSVWASNGGTEQSLASSSEDRNRGRFPSKSESAGSCLRSIAGASRLDLGLMNDVCNSRSEHEVIDITQTETGNVGASQVEVCGIENVQSDAGAVPACRTDKAVHKSDGKASDAYRSESETNSLQSDGKLARGEMDRSRRSNDEVMCTSQMGGEIGRAYWSKDEVVCFRKVVGRAENRGDYSRSDDEIFVESSSDCEVVENSQSDLGAFEDSYSKNGFLDDMRAKDRVVEDSEYGTVEDSCSEHGKVEESRLECDVIEGSRSECAIFDAQSDHGRVLQSKDRQDARLDDGLFVDETSKKTSQSSKRRHESESHTRLLVRSFSPVVTRSKSRPVLRSKKRARTSPYYEYPLLTRRTRFRSKSRSRSRSFSKRKSRRDMFVESIASKKNAAKNDEKLPPVKKRHRSKSAVTSPVERGNSKCSPVRGEGSRKQRNRSFSWSANTTEVPGSSLEDGAQTGNSSLLGDRRNEVTLNNVARKRHASGPPGKRTFCSDLSTEVNEAIANGILSQQSFSKGEGKISNDYVVKLKARALAARKFRPTSRAEDLQRKMMKELQNLYKPAQS